MQRFVLVFLIAKVRIDISEESHWKVFADESPSQRKTAVIFIIGTILAARNKSQHVGESPARNLWGE